MAKPVSQNFLKEKKKKGVCLYSFPASDKQEPLRG